jgi:hypothetical protein
MLPVVRNRVLALALLPPPLHPAPIVVRAPGDDQGEALLERGGPRRVVAAERDAQDADAQRYGAGTVSLTVDLTDGAVTVDAVNTLPPTAGRPAAGSGQGLIGMRERAAAAGGRLDVTAEEGSFRVRAVLPVTEGVLR